MPGPCSSRAASRAAAARHRRRRARQIPPQARWPACGARCSVAMPCTSRPARPTSSRKAATPWPPCVAARICRQWSLAYPAGRVFEHPRLRDQAHDIDRLCQQRQPGTALQRIAPLAEARRAMPLTPAQQRQWFLWKMDTRSTAYHVQGALRITGPLDAGALRAAVQGLAERHGSLRTVFNARPDGEVEQRLDPRAGWSCSGWMLRRPRRASPRSARARRPMAAGAVRPALICSRGRWPGLPWCGCRPMSTSWRW